MKPLRIALRDGGRAGVLAGVLLSVACTGQVSPDNKLAADSSSAATNKLNGVESCSGMWFCDDFEAHTVGALPGAPWKEETYGSGAAIMISTERAFSGQQSMQVSAPKGAPRRGYIAIHSAPVFPAASKEMFGRAMIWLDSAPEPLEATTPVHWSLLQGEGRSADETYNSIYRLGGELQDGLGLKANFETTPPVRTDCRQHSQTTLPVAQWACIEWHLSVETNELQFWLNGDELNDIHIVERGSAPDSNCAHQEDLNGRWLAPSKFQSLYMGLERYDATSNDQNIWIDDVIVANSRVGCPLEDEAT